MYMEGVKTYQDDAKELQEKEVELIRDSLRKAADIKDLREMWFTVRDILNLLALILVPEAEMVLPAAG